MELNFPRTKAGLRDLLSYLVDYDDLDGWCLLFEDFSQLLNEVQLQQLKRKALRIFEPEVLQALMPDVFGDCEEVS